MLYNILINRNNGDFMKNFNKTKNILLCLSLVLSLLFQSCSGEDTSSSNSCSHADSDNNGICDTCSESVIVVVDFYVLNDLHGKIDDTSEQPGVDELTTFLKKSKSSDDNAFFLSSGDMWQGSAESNLTKGKIVTDWMNSLDFTAMTLGNHEFDWGEEFIEENSKIAEFPFLAINVFDKETNQRVSYAKPSVMVECDGIQIGIIGAIGDCYSSISSEYTQGVYFKTGNQLSALVKDEAHSLRNKGADFIVYSLHDGFGSSKNSVTGISDSQLSSYYDVELSNGFVDLVFEGHTHQKYVMTDKYGVYHLQNGGENKGISHAEIGINSVNGKVKTREARFISTDVYSNLNDDPIIDQLKEKYENQLDSAYKVIGQNPSKMSSNQIKQLVAKLYYQKGVAHWGEKYDIALGGGYISVRSPYNLQSGDVTYAQLQTLLPFDNSLVLCSIQGKYLESRFFNTNNSDYFIHYESYGSSVKNNVDYNKTYYIVTDTYCSQYAPNHLTVVEYLDNSTFARDLVADYFKSLNK